MTIGLLRLPLLVLALGGLSVTLIQLTRPMVRVGLPQPGSVPELSSAPAAEQTDKELIDRVLQQPVFRADRRRPSVAYGVLQAPLDKSTPSALPKPVLAVSGILWGSEPAVLMEGVPGVEGSVVLRRGETVGGLRVIGIEGERVVVSGMDTTWRLTVRNPWP